MPWREETITGAEDLSSAPCLWNTETDDPVIKLTLWPNRSMHPEGLGVVLWIVGIGFSLPLIALMGSPVGWGMLPFFMAVLVGLYIALSKNYLDGRLNEVLHIGSGLITIERTEANGEKTCWQANPYWAKPKLHSDAKIESYLTLSGNGRVVELGAFLSPEEREDLYETLLRALRRLSI